MTMMMMTMMTTEAVMRKCQQVPIADTVLQTVFSRDFFDTKPTILYRLLDILEEYITPKHYIPFICLSSP